MSDTEVSKSTISNKIGHRISIGVPVFNGEAYLKQALDSLLAQTFTDFELIISDNASNDHTSDICLDYAKRDSRIKYHRSDTNLGASYNFNHVFKLAKGEFFVWAAHDDLWHPEFLSKCLSVLDNNPSAILAYTATQEVDGNGQLTDAKFPINNELALKSTFKRFAASWRYPPPQILVFGLIRREALKNTRLIADFAASDQVLVSELCLAGEMIGVPEYLFYYRRHIQQSTANPYPTMRSRNAWYNPKNIQRITFPWWRVLREHFVAVTQASIVSWDRLLCYLSLLRWMIRKRRVLARDLLLRDI